MLSAQFQIGPALIRYLTKLSNTSNAKRSEPYFERCVLKMEICKQGTIHRIKVSDYIQEWHIMPTVNTNFCSMKLHGVLPGQRCQHRKYRERLFDFLFSLMFCWIKLNISKHPLILFPGLLAVPTEDHKICPIFGRLPDDPGMSTRLPPQKPKYSEGAMWLWVWLIDNKAKAYLTFCRITCQWLGAITCTYSSLNGVLVHHWVASVSSVLFS